METKTLRIEPLDGDMLRMWRQAAKAFGYENATIGEHDLFVHHERLGISEEDMVDVIEWSKEQYLIERADEVGRVRLTPHGRRLWREANSNA